MSNFRFKMKKGPSKGAFDIGKNIITKLINIVETRLQLAIFELEKEKNNLIQILIISTFTIVFIIFSFISLIALIIWNINIQYRLIAIIITNIVLFILAIIFGIWTLRKIRSSTLLNYTRKELNDDRKLLEEHRS
ncbi:phage holin family protein [Pantoea sp. Mhis]|uniref:phage holin family protein n=1 Tax=Pantoea sp. Mhis TaxID=2576759 RepID=UPI00135A705D|nr:phage holin family protein [Pantoea sp. Mhis]MXP56396.1 hypothetical protein [Pantoea sp. Mhis]